MCDRPRLLNPLHHHPTILPFPQQLVSENPLCSERWDRLQRGRNSAIMSAFCRSLKLGNWSWGIKVITFWHSVPNSSINVLSVELVTEIVRSLSLQLYFGNSQSARSGRKFVRGFKRRARIWDHIVSRWMGMIKSKSIITHSPTPHGPLPTDHHKECNRNWYHTHKKK
jgi:hypothetical protein